MKVIHHVVDVAAPKARVWTALTVHAQMAAWWSTEVTTPTAAVGAQVHWVFVGEFNPVMEITALEPERELGWRCVSGHKPWHDNTFRFELADHGAGTRLRFWQHYAAELGDDAYGIYNFNWGYYLESLRLLCTTGTGRPFVPPG